jgi:HAD superfamily hydrolase (TIGR01509 family)
MKAASHSPLPDPAQTSLPAPSPAAQGFRLNPKLEAIIFDMDGVIVDSEPLHEQAFRDVFDDLGYAQTHGVHFPDYYGRSDEALWQDFVNRHRPPQPFEFLMTSKRLRLIELIRRDQPIFEGLPDLVAKLAAHYPLAVASGSPHPVIDEVLAMGGLYRFFSAVVSVTDVGQPKPAPDVFLRAAALLGKRPDACCVIEDSAVGVTAARSAGMAVIAITNSLPADQLRHATCVVETYDAIEALLL